MENASHTPECVEGRRLYISYMVELGHWGILLRSDQPDRREATECRQRLMKARDAYRKHVDEHRCRRRLGGSKSTPLELAS